MAALRPPHSPFAIRRDAESKQSRTKIHEKTHPLSWILAMFGRYVPRLMIVMTICDPTWTWITFKTVQEFPTVSVDFTEKQQHKNKHCIARFCVCFRLRKQTQKLAIQSSFLCLGKKKKPFPAPVPTKPFCACVMGPRETNPKGEPCGRDKLVSDQWKWETDNMWLATARGVPVGQLYYCLWSSSIIAIEGILPSLSSLASSCHRIRDGEKGTFCCYCERCERR